MDLGSARRDLVGASPRQATMKVASTLRRHVAHLKIDCPPPGRWDEAHRQAFVDEIERLGADPDVSAIVLHGRRLFSDPPSARQAVPPRCSQEIWTAVVQARVPIIAAIAGPCSGSGLELALACAARVVSPAATFAGLAASQGQLPSANALIGLIQVVEIERAADLAVFGAVWDAKTATDAGLVDAVTSRALPEFAAKLAAGLTPNRRASLKVEPEVVAAKLYGLRARLRREASHQDTPMLRLRALECAAQMPPRRAAIEIQRLEEVFAQTDEARALAHAERAEAALARSPQAADFARELRWSLLREAIHLVDEGATPAQVDRELQRFGFHEGPFAESDRLGLDVVFRRQAGPVADEDWIAYSATLDLMADTGRLGGPDAPGWYRHGPDGRRGFEPEVEQLLHASATFQRLSRQALPDALIAERCVFAAMNAAANLLEARPEITANLIDAIWTHELGFPRWRGGPLYMARHGEGEPVAALERWMKVRNTAGAPAPLLRRIAVRA